MIMIQRVPSPRAIPLLLFASLALGVALHGLAGFVIDLEEHRVLAIGVAALVAAAGLVIGLRLAYRDFAVDPAARTVRMGGRVVPIDSVREAWRSVSSAGNRSGYLVYRFRSTEGPAVRVLVLGSPISGIDAAGRDALVSFLELAPIPGPAAAQESARDAAVADILGDGKKVPVSAAALVRELRGIRPDAPAPATAVPATAAATDAAAAIGAPPAHAPFPADLADADDLAALETLRREGAGLRRARRVFGILFGLVLAGVVVLAVVAIIAEAVGSPAEGAVPATIAGFTALAVAVTGLGWSVLGDLDTRATRAASRRWFESADEAARARGLPAPFHAAWLQFAPGHRILTVAAFAAGAVGLILLLGGPIAMSMGESALGFMALPGLVLGGLAIWFWVAHRRRRRADVAWLIEAAGPRAGL